MDFIEAIKVHGAWKQKLKVYIENPNKSLIASEVEKDNCCDLGKWIYGEGSKYSALPEYLILKKEHANFHKCAADIVKRADAGQSLTDEVIIGSGSPFSTASINVVSAIMTLKDIHLKINMRK